MYALQIKILMDRLKSAEARAEYGEKTVQKLNLRYSVQSVPSQTVLCQSIYNSSSKGFPFGEQKIDAKIGSYYHSRKLVKFCLISQNKKTNFDLFPKKKHVTCSSLVFSGTKYT